MNNLSESDQPGDSIDGLQNDEGYFIHLAEVELEKLDARDAAEAANLVDFTSEPRRGPIDLVWQLAADDKLTTQEKALWTEIIAKRVMRLVINQPTGATDQNGKQPQRAERALRALGLFGQADENYDAEQHLLLLLDFIPLAKRRSGDNRALDTRLAVAMQAAGYYPNVSLKNAINRVKRLREKL